MIYSLRNDSLTTKRVDYSLPSQSLCTAYSQQLTLANNELLLGQDKYLGGTFIFIPSIFVMEEIMNS